MQEELLYGDGRGGASSVPEPYFPICYINLKTKDIKQSPEHISQETYERTNINKYE